MVQTHEIGAYASSEVVAQLGREYEMEEAPSLSRAKQRCGVGIASGKGTLNLGVLY